MKIKQRIINVDRNHNHVKTNIVQIWINDTMAGLIKNEEAKELVKSGNFGVSTEQAIFNIPQNSKHTIYV